MAQTHLLLACRAWHRGMAARLEQATGDRFLHIATPEELDALDIAALAPRYVFVPHWSWILPQSLWGRHETIIFHMTDLPFGRGGSPLQNLIVRGFRETSITALRCEAALDAGPVYCRRPLSLLGTAEEIFIRATEQIEAMIRAILADAPTPVPQQGPVTRFQRRTPQEGSLANLASLEEVYDHIRMLDAEGYPPAFLEAGPLRLEFKRASLRHDRIEADVVITIANNEGNDNA